MHSLLGGEMKQRRPLRFAATTVVVTTVMGSVFAGSIQAGSAITPSQYGIGDPVTYATGPNPTSEAVGDLNGDGRPDLVTANVEGPDISVSALLADPAGGYQSPASYPLDLGGFARIAVADVTGDGNVDVVIAGSHFGFGAVDVLAGDGTGALGTPTEYGLATGSGFGLAVQDLNDDGYLDLAVSSTANVPTNPGTVDVLLNDRAGSFDAPVAYPVGINPKDVAIADITHDGNPDLVVANYGSDSVSVLAGDGSGAFATASSYPTGTDPGAYGLAVEDLNGDDYPDVVVTKFYYDEVSVLLNDGSGGLGTASNLATGGNGRSTDVAVADVNGDNAPDLIAIDNQPRVFYGNGDGTFAAAHGTGSWNDAGLAVTDLNGDNRPDILTGEQMDSGNAVVFLQETAPTSIQKPGITHRATIYGLVFAGEGTWTGSPHASGYHFDWQRCGLHGCVDTGASDSSQYYVTSDDLGYALRVGVTASNAVGTSARAYSLRTTVVQPQPAAVTAPTIGYTAGSAVLVADHGTWSGAPKTYSYYWFLCDNAGDNCDYLHHGQTLATTQDMVGDRVELDVDASGPTGTGVATVLSDPIVGIEPSNHAPPTITGNPVVGASLTAAKGTWWGTAPRGVHYQWQRCIDGGSCTDIPHGTAPTYTVTAADVDYTIVIEVTGINAYGSASATSAPTATVQVSS